MQARAIIGLDWVWIGIALTIPLGIGLVVAMVFGWHQRDALMLPARTAMPSDRARRLATP